MARWGRARPILPRYLFGAEIVVTGQAQTLTGTVFAKAPTFPQGAVIPDQTLTGAIFSKAPTFPQGAVIRDQFLIGALFSKAPTFPQG
jgi:hypothetical protein